MAKKKALLGVVCVAMIALIAVFGTVAYLTDRDSETNVFTSGDVAIKLTEDFTQGAQLLPGVDVEKEVVVTNSGKNDAWVWVTIAIPADLDNANDASQNALHFNYAKESVGEDLWTWQDTSGWMMEAVKNFNDTGLDYNVYTVMYQTALKPGESTPSAMTKVYLDPHLDIDPEGNWYHVENGVANSLNWNNEKGNPVMYVNAYAIQADVNIDTVQEGYDAYQSQWGENGTEYGDVPTTVANADEMIAALENGEGVILTDDVKIDPAGMSNAYGTTGINVKNGQTIDGGGHILDIKGAGGTWDSGINTTGGLIKDITVTGSFRGIFINHNSSHSEPVVLENVTIDGTTYTISCDQGLNQTLTATDSTFKGWTSYAATLGEATFTNCDFGKGNGYAYMRPYAPTTFVGCEFEAGYRVDPRAAVTFENCTLGGVPLTADNLATLVISNIANATVK